MSTSGRLVRRRRAALVVLWAAAVLVAGACGNRNSHDAVVAAAGGLPQEQQADGSAAVIGGTSGAGAGTSGGSALPGSAPSAGSAPVKGGTAVQGARPGQPARPGGKAPAVAGKQDTTPVMICQLGHFTGFGGPTQGNAQPGLAAWVRWTNQNGGLAGHPVQLDSKDDSMDPNRARQIVQHCVENERAVAIVAAFVPATVDSIASYLRQKKVPVVGGDAVTRTWFTDPNFFPEGSAQTGTANGQVRIMVDARTKAAGIIYCTENVACTQGKDFFTQAAKQQRLTVKGTYQVSLANPSFTSQCSIMKDAGIDAVYTALDGASTQRLARDCNAMGYKPLYVSGGLAIDAEAAAEDPNLDGMTISTSVFPWMTATTPAARAFQEAMARYAPDVNPTESAAKAWVSGQLLAKAISNVGVAARQGPITSAMILQGLHKVQRDNLAGLVMGQLTFAAGKPAVPNVCWSVATLRSGKWSAPQGARATCA